jgi:von Willebrand factor type A domain
MRRYTCLFVGMGMVLGACSVDPDGQAVSSGGAFPGLDAGPGASASAGDASSGQTGANPPAAPGSVSAPSGEGVGCEAHVVMGTRATPDMLIVLDRSGSMNPDNNDDMTDRWGGSRMALIDVTANFGDKVRFGLMTFPGARSSNNNNNDDAQCAPGMLDVPIGLNAGPAIASTLQMMNADGRTPTAAALQAALPIIGGVAPAPDQTVPPKYVLLVTDGDPNCGDGGGGGRGGGGRDNAARMQTIAAIEALAAAGVKTYVVGYQTAGSDFVDQLDRMAAAGATGETMHRSVASGADLNATFSEIASNVISCSYQLGMPVNDPSKVLVRVSGRGRNINDAADGFRIEQDKRTITLTGKACEEVRQGAAFAVQVTCEAVPLF